MKRKNKIVAILSAIAVAIGVVAGAGALSARANAETWSVADFAAGYVYGETVDIPDRTVSIGENSTIALSTITYPSGKVTREKRVRLGEAGNWTVRYYAELDGKHYAKDETFFVEGRGYNVKSKNSSVEWSDYTDLGITSTGLLVRLANKDSLTFTGLIDVGDLSASAPFVSGFITPDQRGVHDFNKLTFTLTDATDDSVYVKFDINRSQFGTSGYNYGWVSAGGNGQDMVGIEGSKLHVNDNVGTDISLTFNGLRNISGWGGATEPVAVNATPFTLAFDSATKQVYAQQKLVSDLDSSKFYSDLWSGFKSGKVRLSVSASGYSSATANFCILSVAGTSAADLKNNYFADSEEPEITVDTDYETMPDAEVGTPYAVPSASAYDYYSGTTDVETSVIYDYYSENPTSIGVRDGKFIPEKPGVYAIEYAATDGYKNRANKVLFVRARAGIADLTINLPDEITSAQLGKFVPAHLPEVSGGSGRIDIETAVIFGGKRTVVNGGFTPENSGEYTVEFVATDYIGKRATASYKVIATPGDKPLLDTDPVLMRVYLSGSEYVLPVAYASDYSGGSRVGVLCDVKVKDSTGEKTYKAGERFTPSVAANGDEIEIAYFAKGVELYRVAVPTIIARDGKKVFMSNYLYGKTVNVDVRDAEGETPYKNGLSVAPCAGTDVAGWTFANPVLAEGATVDVRTISGKTNFDGFVFSLVDPENPTVAVSLKVAINSRRLGIEHAGNEYELDVSIKSDSNVRFAYAGGKFSVTANEKTLSVPVVYTDNGEKFDGFPTHKAFMGLSTTGNADGAKYMVMNVCDNALSYRNADNSAPSFSIVGDYGGKWAKGTTYVIHKGEGGDVFAPSTKVAFTAYNPDGSVASDVNGKRLENVVPDADYSIVLASYGQYKIEYKIEEVDWVGKSKTFTVIVNVLDREDPVIEWTSKGTEEAKVGDVIVMPNYSVKDNVTESKDIAVSVYVINAEGRTIELEGGSNSIKCEHAGIYTFMVYAVDKDGNAAVAKWRVNVK